MGLPRGEDPGRAARGRARLEPAPFRLSATCTACGGTLLEPHLKVAGAAGPEGFTPTTDRFGTALSDIVRCAGCGHMQLERFPPDPWLAEAYARAESSDYLDEEPGQRATARQALTTLERYAKGRRLLDLGCWAGFLLDEARQRGWETLGVEPSGFASAYARERLGLDVRTAGLFSAELEPGSFDAVVLGDVIEHLPDPGAALDRVAELSGPGAVLYLTLPDAGSRVARVLGGRWWSVVPTHVQYFTRNSIATLLARRGWQVLELHTAPKAFTVRYYVSRIGGYSSAAAGALVALAELAGVAGRLWAPDFRDRMAVVAGLRSASTPSAASSRT
jgi:SAM-dependent methyltransferase